MEEWRQLQAIIARHEGLVYQVRGWLLVLLVAFVAVRFDDDPRLSTEGFFAVACVIILAFAFMELLVRVSKRQAIQRVGDVEKCLRPNSEDVYDGPQITVTFAKQLGKCERMKRAGSEFLLFLVWPFYVLLVIVVAILACSPTNQEAPMDADELHSLVSDAIWRAVQIDGRGAGSAAGEWATVSSLEEKLADIIPVSASEGRIARRGAVRAAFKAGDHARGRLLAERYMAEEGAPASLKEALREIVGEDR